MKLIGRHKELEMLENFVFSSKSPILWLYGEGGIGKTTLLHQFVHQFNKQLRNNYYYFQGNSLFDGNEITSLIGNRNKLIIIDDYNNIKFQHPDTTFHSDQAYISDIPNIIRHLVESDKTRKIIVSTRSKPQFSKGANNYFEYLNLGRLDHNDIQKIVRNYFDSHEFDKVINQFYKCELPEYFHLNPNSILTALHELTSNMFLDVTNFKDYLEEPLIQNGLVDLEGMPLSTDSNKANRIIKKIKVINNSLVDKFHANPQFAFQITPRQFEELVAELLAKEGFSSNLTKKTHDGGKDILIAQNNSLGNFMYYIECKQYSPQNTVGVNLVRELYGTLSHDRATAGLMVTTSSFSKEAIEFSQNIKYQLSLKDFIDLKQWANRIKNPNTVPNKV